MRRKYSDEELLSYIGKQFGRLVVTSVSRGDDRRMRASCICTCGGVTTPTLSSLVNENVRSCGCLWLDSVITSNSSHGHSKGFRRSRTMTAYHNMHTRCYNRTSSKFKDYGARGITVDDRWSTFEVFLEDMGECPEGMTIDRVDVNLGYNKDNCRWVTNKEQARNKRNTVYLTIRGVTKPLITWCEERGMPYRTVRSRVSAGWSDEKALDTPVKQYGDKNASHK